MAQVLGSLPPPGGAQWESLAPGFSLPQQPWLWQAFGSELMNQISLSLCLSSKINALKKGVRSAILISGRCWRSMVTCLFFLHISQTLDESHSFTHCIYRGLQSSFQTPGEGAQLRRNQRPPGICCYCSFNY